MALSRRAFVGTSAGAVAAAGLGLLAVGPDRVKRAVLARVAEGLPDAPPAALGEATGAALHGFLEVYLPPSSAPPAAVAATVSWADGEARRVRGWGRALGEGLDALGGEAGRELFARSDTETRRRALDERFQRARATDYLTASGRAYARFRHYVLPAIVTEHFAGAAGWAVVGYTMFPGRCGAARAYTQPPTSTAAA